jgi:hypothetical protein
MSGIGMGNIWDPILKGIRYHRGFCVVLLRICPDFGRKPGKNIQNVNKHGTRGQRIRFDYVINFCPNSWLMISMSVALRICEPPIEAGEDEIRAKEIAEGFERWEDQDNRMQSTLIIGVLLKVAHLI